MLIELIKKPAKWQFKNKKLIPDNLKEIPMAPLFPITLRKPVGISLLSSSNLNDNNFYYFMFFSC